MQKAQSGDAVAYRDLLERLAPVIRKYLSRRLFDQDSVEDLTQDTLIAVHKAKHTYRADLPFDRWLYSIARYKLMDNLRKKYRDADHSMDVETFSSILTNIDQDGDAADIQKAFGQLTPRQRQLVQLAKVDGYTAVEIGRTLGMSENAVKVSIHRSLIIMRKWLIENGYE